jgi:hypothetical protein
MSGAGEALRVLLVKHRPAGYVGNPGDPALAGAISRGGRKDPLDSQPAGSWKIEAVARSVTPEPVGRRPGSRDETVQSEFSCHPYSCERIPG